MKYFLIILCAVALVSFCEGHPPKHKPPKPPNNRKKHHDPVTSDADPSEELEENSATAQRSLYASDLYDLDARASLSVPTIYGGSEIISEPYNVIQQAKYWPPTTVYETGYAGYGDVIETDRTKVVTTIVEERTIIEKAKSFIRIIWDLITLLPKSAIRHGLFIPLRIAKFIYVVGKTILDNIDNTIASRINFWKYDVYGGIRDNIIADNTSVRNVLRDLLDWIARGFELHTTSRIPLVDLPHTVYDPFVVKLRTLSRDLKQPSAEE